ncbi:MAG: cation/H(+) antiporter [Bacteroidetes bacterium]|nr:MAG: cation/H(+) antiporter [Bacteroidota bacterium]
MNKKRNLLFYFLMIAVFGTFIYWILKEGALQHTAGSSSVPSVHQTDPSSSNNFQLFASNLQHHLSSPLPILLLQIIVIVLCTRLVGLLFNRIGQPAVIGEIVAGIILGPSLLGLFFPGISGFIFPPSSMNNLQFISQVGLILFMFVVGLEVDLDIIRKQAFEAVIISHASIIIPYALGMGLSLFLYEEFAPKNISFLAFSLFMGIAMSITAFPVLARIIQERGMTKSRLGTLSLTCAASDDVTAWCILAILIAIIKAGSSTSAFFSIALVIVFISFMIFLLRPLLERMYIKYSSRKIMQGIMMPVIFMILLLSAYATEAIGIHALFGSFLAGVIMPHQLNFRKFVIDKIEDISKVLFLPLFFAFTGLRTQIGLLNQGYLWVALGLILLAAVLGKFGGSVIAARAVGQNWRDSLSIGALMNTRGLMELIVLNIGYDLGILSPEIFAMLVLMALITTFMTNPALNLINATDSKPEVIRRADTGIKV